MLALSLKSLAGRRLHRRDTAASKLRICVPLLIRSFYRYGRCPQQLLGLGGGGPCVQEEHGRR
jgi:hypothetical protein